MIRCFVNAGNRWQSVAVTQLGYDDEVHGAEAGASAQDLQPSDEDQRPTPHVALTENGGKPTADFIFIIVKVLSYTYVEHC